MRLKLFSLVLLALVLASCDIAVETTPPEPTPLVCHVPVITAFADTKMTQTKGGVEITATPVTYATQVTMEESRREVQPPLLSIRSKGATRYVEITKFPVISVHPDGLRFRVLINNQLPRVFRGAGAIVQFSFAGKVLAIGANNYDELTNVIIAPRQQQEIFISGPALTQLPAQKLNLGVFIYDVVTKVDGAGNILEKQNFEWFFDYDLQEHKESGPAVQRIHVWI